MHGWLQIPVVICTRYGPMAQPYRLTLVALPLSQIGIDARLTANFCLVS